MASQSNPEPSHEPNLEAARAPRGPWSRLFLVLLAAYAVWAIVPLASDETRDFHDFETYYFAGQAAAQGLDPYDLPTLRQVSGGVAEYPFLYPPQTLLAFELLASLEFETAAQVFLACKLLALAALLVLWSRVFLGGLDVAFLGFCLVAFNSPIYLDLSVGNVSLFEQVLLWVGLRQYLRGDLRGFSLAVLGASFFKLSPILLLLLLFRRGVAKRELRWFLGCSGVLATSVIASWVAQPEAYAGFVSNLRSVRFLGVVNPSSLTIFQFTANGLGKDLGTTFPSWLPWTGYALVVATVLTLTVRALRGLRGCANSPQADHIAVLLCVLAYALVLPRLPDYGYVLVLLPAYYAIRHAQPNAFPWLFLLMAHQALNIRLPGAQVPYNIALAHMPLLLAFIAWGLLLGAARRQRPST